MATKRNRHRLAAAVAVALLGSSAAQAGETGAGREQHMGTAAGALAGAVLGGPPGVILGAIGGTLIGREAARERADEAQRQEVARLQDALSDARQRLSSLQERIPPAGAEPGALQVATAAPLPLPRSAPDAGAWGLQLQVQFRTASTALEAHYHAPLDGLAALLADSPDAVLVVEGHADPRGEAPDNLTLSEQRVAAVRRYLETAGMDASRIRTHAFGEQRPLFEDESLESRNFERRVVIRIEPRERTS